MELGTQMGLKDASRQQFIKDEQARLRDERELELQNGMLVRTEGIS